MKTLKMMFKRSKISGRNDRKGKANSPTRNCNTRSTILPERNLSRKSLNASTILKAYAQYVMYNFEQMYFKSVLSHINFHE